MYNFLSWVVSGIIILSGVGFLLSIGIVFGVILIGFYELGRLIVNTLKRHYSRLVELRSLKK